MTGAAARPHPGRQRLHGLTVLSVTLALIGLGWTGFVSSVYAANFLVRPYGAFLLPVAVVPVALAVVTVLAILLGRTTLMWGATIPLQLVFFTPALFGVPYLPGLALILVAAVVSTLGAPGRRGNRLVNAFMAFVFALAAWALMWSLLTVLT